MKRQLVIALVIMGCASTARGNLFVGLFDNSAVPNGDYSTVLEFDNSGNQISSFNPGLLPENQVNVAATPGADVYSISNSVGSVDLSQLNPITGQSINGGDVTASGVTDYSPAGLTIGPDGYIYVAGNTVDDSGTIFGAVNIYRVNPTNLSASLYLPSVTPYPSSVGNLFFGPNSNLYFVDFGDVGDGNTEATAIWKYNTTTDKLTKLVSAPDVYASSGIAFGPNGNLFVSTESGIQEYNPSNGSVIETFIADGTDGLSGAGEIAFAPDGSLYVQNEGTNDILRFDGTTGTFLNVAVPESALSDAPYGTYGIQSFAYVPEPTGMVSLIAGIGILLRRSRKRSY